MSSHDLLWVQWKRNIHYNDVIMSAMASQITSLTIVCSTVYSVADQRKLCVTGLCRGIPPVTGEFHSQRASNAENISIWWRHQLLITQTVSHIYATVNCPYLFNDANLSFLLWNQRNSIKTNWIEVDDVIIGLNLVITTMAFELTHNSSITNKTPHTFVNDNNSYFSGDMDT